LTTIVGFGSLMIASHQGLQSLGRVLTIGVTCCLFTSLIMLPALMTWFTRHRKDEVVVAPPSAESHRAALRRRYDPRQKVPTVPHASPAHRPEIRKTAA
jgi:predicted RND superfamily exporter protein